MSQIMIPVDGKLTKEEHAATREVLGKCLVGDEPLKVKHKIVPAADSVREAIGGMFRGAEIINTEKSGTCPNCGARVTLSAKGFITSHSIRNAPIPTPKALSETSMDVADTGSHVGDPEAGFQRRVVEANGAFQAGTVQIPVKGENGRTKLTDVPGTEENVRAALAYWHARKPRTDSARQAQNRNVSELTRRLGAMTPVQTPVFDKPTKRYSTVVARGDDGPVGMSAKKRPEGVTAQMSPGPALVKGRDNGASVRDPGLPFTENMSARRRGTLDEPLGRERFDRRITDVPEPPRRRTASERRRYRQETLAAHKGK